MRTAVNTFRNVFLNAKRWTLPGRPEDTVSAGFFYRFQLLFATSEAIEQRPLLRRPRFMGAAWGGLLICKLAATIAARRQSAIFA